MPIIPLLILTDTAVAGPGGSERFLRNLIGLLSPERYRVDVLQLSAPLHPKQWVGELPQGPHLRYEHHPVGPVYGAAGWGAYLRVSRRVLRGDYQIVQSQHEKSDLINALLPRGGRDIVKVSCRRDMGFQKTRKVQVAFRRLNSRFDHFLAPTSAILDSLQQHENAPAGRSLCIPNGVDTAMFAPAGADACDAMRASFGFGREHLVIGCVASFSPVKRHVDLVAAFSRVQAALPEARLLLVGDGPLRADIEQQVGSLGLGQVVQFAGMRSDMAAVLPSMDVFALCSSTEGMSNAIIEAQACGLPVVATSVGGNPDLVHPGIDGELVPARDVAALAAALIAYGRSADLRAQAGAAARRQTVRQYSLEAMVQAYDSFYQRALAERSRPRAGGAAGGARTPR